MTCGICHVACAMWHVPCGMCHVACATTFHHSDDFFLLGTDRFITQTSFKILCMQHVNKAVSWLDMGNAEAIV